MVIDVDTLPNEPPRVQPTHDPLGNPLEQCIEPGCKWDIRIGVQHLCKSCNGRLHAWCPEPEMEPNRYCTPCAKATKDKHDKDTATNASQAKNGTSSNS